MHCGPFPPVSFCDSVNPPARDRPVMCRVPPGQSQEVYWPGTAKKEVTLQKPGAAGIGECQSLGMGCSEIAALPKSWYGMSCVVLSCIALEVPALPVGCCSPSGDGCPAGCPDSLVGGAGWQNDGLIVLVFHVFL